jgi:hypothetical protein
MEDEKRQVTEAVDKIVELVAELDKALMQLEQRLAPILSEPKPLATIDKSTIDRSDSKMVPLVEKLDLPITRLFVIVEYLRQLDTRIEL